MTKSTTLSRRAFVAANAAVAVAATAPSTVNAMGCAYGESHEATTANWYTATAKDLEQLIGDRFRVRSENAGELVLRLVAVEPVNSGSNRPAGLARSESVVAVFDSPDKAPLVACGHQIHRFSHHKLGSADLSVAPSCMRNGDHVIELVLG